MTGSDLAVAAAFLLVATLYASIGHGGASGYLAAMALLGTQPELMRPVALSLNLLVAGLATYHFRRAGHFSWAIFWPFAVTSIPLAAVGGALSLPGTAYRWVIAVALLVAVVGLARSASMPSSPTRPLRTSVALSTGAGLGLVSGLVGVGGGIFLSPLLLMGRWAGARTTAAVSAAFVFVNSVAGLTALVATQGVPAAPLPVWIAAAGVGGLIGSRVGSLRFAGPTIRRLLAVVLLLAAIKFILT